LRLKELELDPKPPKEKSKATTRKSKKIKHPKETPPPRITRHQAKQMASMELCKQSFEECQVCDKYEDDSFCLNCISRNRIRSYPIEEIQYHLPPGASGSSFGNEYFHMDYSDVYFPF
jgi:hypothetical protein